MWKPKYTNSSIIPAPVYSLPSFIQQWVFSFDNNLKLRCWYLSFLLGDSGNAEVSRDGSVNAESMGVSIKPWRYRLVCIEAFINVTTTKMTNSVSAIVLQSDCYFLVKFISIEFSINLNGERHSHSRVRLNWERQHLGVDTLYCLQKTIQNFEEVFGTSLTYTFYSLWKLPFM